jgi:hypothetical protein
MFLAGVAGAQGKMDLPSKGTAYTDFIPKGFDTLQYGFVKGDLNKDGREDVAMALFNKEAEEKHGEYDGGPARLLLILFNNGNGYSLTERSSNAILCYNCGGAFGDPFAGVWIKNNVLTIDHYGGASWRWAYNHKFRYQSGTFQMIGKTYHNYWSVMTCEKLEDEFPGTYEDINLVTGQREFKQINEDCQLLADKKDKVAVKPLIKLKDFNINSVIE